MKQGEGVAFSLVDVALLACQQNQSIFQVFGTPPPKKKKHKKIKKKKDSLPDKQHFVQLPRA